MEKKNLNNFFNLFENNEYFIIYLTSIIIIHVCFMDNKIPNFIETLFKNKIFKMIAIILLIMRASNNNMIPIMLTLLFLITLDKSSMNQLNRTKEQFEKTINNTNNNDNQNLKNENEYDISYKKLLEKLEEVKESFSQDLDTFDYTTCPNQWSSIKKDYPNDEEDINLIVKTEFFNTRCNDKTYNPKSILNQINQLESTVTSLSGLAKETIEKNIKSLKFKYNVSKKIFDDFEFPNDELKKLQIDSKYNTWKKEINLNNLENQN